MTTFFLLLFVTIIATPSESLLYPVIPNPVEIDLTLNPDKPFYERGERIELTYSIYLNKRKSPQDIALEYLIECIYPVDCLELINIDSLNNLIHINNVNYKLNGSLSFIITKQTDEIIIKMQTYRSFGPDGANKIIENLIRYTNENPPPKIAGSYYDSRFMPEIIVSNSSGKLIMYVFDNKKNPIRDVQIKILGMNAEKYSDERGVVFFYHIPTGYYNIQISKTGYLKYTLLNVPVSKSGDTPVPQYLPKSNTMLDSVEFVEYYKPYTPLLSSDTIANGLDGTGDLLIHLNSINSIEPFYFVIDKLKIGNVSFKSRKSRKYGSLYIPIKRISNIPVGIYSIKVINESLGKFIFENIEIENNLTKEVWLDSLIFEYENGTRESENNFK